MAKIPLKEITFPGLDNTYTIPEIDNTLSTAGKAADAKKTGDEISELKEDLNATNAEVTDIRVGANGITYNSAGDATRGQYTELNKSITNIFTSYGIALIKDKYINALGQETAGAGRYCSEYIPCPPDTSVTYVGENNHANIKGLSFYDKNFVFISGDGNNGQAKGTPTTVKSPEKTCYCRLSTDDALVNAGSYYIEIAGKNKPFVFTNQRITEVEKSITEIKKNIDPNVFPFAFPNDFVMNPDIKVYTDGHKYSTDFDANNYKNVGGNILYVSPFANAGGDGTRSNPYQYAAAYNAAQDGDTIVLMKGIYSRAGQFFTEIKKSINVIGEDGVVILLGNITTFTPASGHNNVYVGQRSSGAYVFDISDAPNRVIPLQSVNSISDCEQTVGSYFKDSGYYYVHPFADGDPTGKLMISVINTAEIPMSVSNNDQDVNVYIGNITIVGNQNGTRVNMASNENDLTVCYDNVKFILCGYDNTNTFTAYGGNVILHKCEVCGSYRDGLNYNGSAVGGTPSRPCNIIEIDCKSGNCGIGQTQETMNASTSHLGAKVLRVNCEYHDCLGPNCADVQEGTQSVNLGCSSYDSTASASGQNNAFQTNKEGAYMWLYDCLGVGNAIDYNATEGATMILVNCAYDTKADSVTSENRISVGAWLARHK